MNNIKDIDIMEIVDTFRKYLHTLPMVSLWDCIVCPKVHVVMIGSDKPSVGRIKFINGKLYVSTSGWCGRFFPANLNGTFKSPKKHGFLKRWYFP